MFHRATWTTDQKVCRRAATEADFVEADLLSQDNGSRITAEDNLQRICEIYGSNPLTYPLCIYRVYTDILDKWGCGNC